MIMMMGSIGERDKKEMFRLKCVCYVVVVVVAQLDW